MSVYYNEIEPYCIQWLRNLMDAGLIPAGDIDTRSIEDVIPNELRGYTQCHFFAGLGGWAYALQLAGWGTRPVWTGSCPCQPFSAAGKRAGLTDERDLWPAWHYLIAQRSPAIILGEQVEAAIGHRWLDRAFSDLEGCGYAAGACVLPASAVNAPHQRRRIWIVADTERNLESWQEPRFGAHRRVGRIEQLSAWNAGWAQALAVARTMDDGIPRCVEATDAARNAIVPQVAAAFITAYMQARGLISNQKVA